MESVISDKESDNTLTDIEPLAKAFLSDPSFSMMLSKESPCF